MFDRIFIPLDGSAEARSILPWIEAWNLKSPRFILFHCLRSRLPSGEVLGHSRFESAEIAREYLEGIARDLPGESEVVVRAGFPGDRIVTAALQSNADLVVLGETGQYGVPRMPGRITDMVARTCPLPLLLVRTPLPTPPRRIRRILVPLDGPSAVGENLELLREISQALRSEVILLHVGSPEPEAAELRQLPSGAGGPDDPEAQFQLMHQVWNFLKDSIAVSDVRLNLIQQVWTFLKREIAARTVMTKGSLVEETLSHERSMDADLVAVARGGPGPDPAWSAILRRAERAVLLYENRDLGRTAVLPAIREQEAPRPPVRSVTRGASLSANNFLKTTQHS
jgi:nucleotide-binding universal stress UspA family protein